MQKASTSKIFSYGKRLLLVSCLIGCFFWAGRWSLDSSSLSFPNQTKPLIFYANQTGSDLRLLFYQTLAQAEKSIYLEMYAITDPNIIQILRAQAKKGVAVTILTDGKASPGLKKKLADSAALHLHKGKGLMHRKVLVIDHRLTLLGSVNFTPTSLTLHDNFALAVLDTGLADFFEKEQEEPACFNVKRQEVEAWKLPKKGDKAKAAIIRELDKARKSIHVAMFTLTDRDLVDALIAAHGRGVKVALAIDYYTAGGSSKLAFEKLQQAGIPMRTSLGAQLLHHKWAFVDGTTLITGSTNWTKSAFACNRDDFVIIRNLTEEQQKLMVSLWRSIESMSQLTEVSVL